MGKPFGVDFGAVMMIGQARGVDTALLADVLPAMETAVLKRFHEDGPDDEEE